MKNAKLFFVGILFVVFVSNNYAMGVKINTPETVRKQRLEHGTEILKKAFKDLIKENKVVIPRSSTQENFINDFLEDQGMGCEGFSHKKKREIKKQIIEWYLHKRNSSVVISARERLSSNPNIFWQTSYILRKKAKTIIDDDDYKINNKIVDEELLFNID